eukprot:scaffold34741_cov63-Phaeocystis_antarctica.AAC.3
MLYPAAGGIMRRTLLSLGRSRCAWVRAGESTAFQPPGSFWSEHEDVVEAAAVHTRLAQHAGVEAGLGGVGRRRVDRTRPLLADARLHLAGRVAVVPRVGLEQQARGERRHARFRVHDEARWRGEPATPREEQRGVHRNLHGLGRQDVVCWEPRQLDREVGAARGDDPAGGGQRRQHHGVPAVGLVLRRAHAARQRGAQRLVCSDSRDPAVGVVEAQRERERCSVADGRLVQAGRHR